MTTEQPAIARAISCLGAARWLDGGVATLGRLADRVTGSEARRDVLEGTGPGHALHPALADLPIGFWTSAFVLDFPGPTIATPDAASVHDHRMNIN